MPIVTVSLTKDDFDNAKLEEAISHCNPKHIRYYYTAIVTKAKEAKEVGDEKTFAVLVLLSDVASMILKLDFPKQPFAPLFIFDNMRGAILDDFNSEELTFLKEIFPLVTDVEMRARIGDILWVAGQNHQIISDTVDAYLEAATLLEHPKDWRAGAERIERALQLAKLANNKTAVSKTISYIENILDKYKKDSLYISVKFMSFLQEYKKGDYVKYAQLAGDGAQQAEKAGNWSLARGYWYSQADWYNLAQDTDNKYNAQLRAAETYVQEARVSVNILPQGVPPSSGYSYIIASHLIQDAIEAFRKIKGTEKRREELHKILLDYQQKSIAEMKNIPPDNSEVEVLEFIQQAAESVKGKPLFNALFHLALFGSSPKVTELKKCVEQSRQGTSLLNRTPTIFRDEHGKIIAHKPPLFSDNQEEAEIALSLEMFNAATLFHLQQTLILQAMIEQINLEHNVRISDFLAIVSNNPLVPLGRELLYAQGLHAGLIGDYITATHYLVPQFENSIRHLLRQRGIPTSKLDKNNIQMELDLNTTLRMSEVEEIFGEDIIFDLKGLLIEHTAANIRNRMAHGLMSHAEFSSTEAQYLWWLMLQLCCLVYVNVRVNSESAKQD